MADCYRVGIAIRLCSMHAVLYISASAVEFFFITVRKGERDGS